MKRFQTMVTPVIAIMILAMLSCNDPLQIGTELLEQGDLDFVSTDTVSIEAVSTQLDSIIAYKAPNFIFSSQRMGWISDPIFGAHISELVTQILPESFSRPVGTVDSVRLTIGYDTLGIYGDADASFDLAVYDLSTSLSAANTYYTDFSAITASQIGSATSLEVTDVDSIDIVEIGSDGSIDTLRVLNRMRLKLDNSFGEQLFNIDSVNYTSAASFLEVVNGLLIKPVSANNAMVSLLIPGSKVSVFYKNVENELRQYDYFIGGTSFTAHDHDYTAGTIDGAIDSKELSKELLYLQGAGGPSISVKFPYLQSLPNIVVNEAILELTTELLPQDDRVKYPLPSQMYISFKQDSILVLTSDISTAIQGFGDIDLFGGQPEEITSDGSTRIVYRFNLSDHIQSMIDGSVSDEIFIQLSQNSNGVQRAVFKGINNTENPIKLKITYTEI